MQAYTELVVTAVGILTTDRYIREILEPHVVPFALFIDKEFIFFKNAKMMRTPSSPNLNPIKYLWYQTGRQIRALQPPPNTLNISIIAL